MRSQSDKQAYLFPCSPEINQLPPPPDATAGNSTIYAGDQFPFFFVKQILIPANGVFRLPIRSVPG